MYFPGILKEAQRIVDETVGRHRVPTFDDIPRMPYIIAMIRESFRWRTVAPVAIPHAAVEDDIYEGYFIPKGAAVFALSHYIHRKEELYPDPESFKPERFLDEYGQLNNLPHAGFGLWASPLVLSRPALYSC
jgi:cytochrome P450